MQYKSLSKNIANFGYGQSIQCMVINALDFGLGYMPFHTGIENQYSIIKKHLRTLAHSTNDKETYCNIEEIRKDPDAVLLSPRSGKIIKLEIKSRQIRTLEYFIKNNFNNNEIKSVMKFHPNVRFLYVDLEKRRIASIYAGDPLNVEAQYDNWYRPWTWIDGISNTNELVKWQEEYIFSPLMIQSEKIVGRLGNEIYQT